MDGTSWTSGQNNMSTPRAELAGARTAGTQTAALSSGGNIIQAGYLDCVNCK